MTFHRYDEDCWNGLAGINRKEDIKHKIMNFMVTPYLQTPAERRVGSEDGQYVYTVTYFHNNVCY